MGSWITSQFDTAPKPIICSSADEGVGLPVSSTLLQNKGHLLTRLSGLDYQSVRHCSKTDCRLRQHQECWITSQFDTAPKRHWSSCAPMCGWITSQFDTAPKPTTASVLKSASWITSQFDTAPKLLPNKRVRNGVGLPVSSTLLQNFRNRC